MSVDFNRLKKKLGKLARHRSLRDEYKELGYAKLVGKNGKCAVCGRGPVACAHVMPVEEGGRAFAANFLPLCDANNRRSWLVWDKTRKPKKLKRISRKQIVCHGLFDKEAWWSREAMREAARDWWLGKEVKLRGRQGRKAQSEDDHGRPTRAPKLPYADRAERFIDFHNLAKAKVLIERAVADAEKRRNNDPVAPLRAYAQRVRLFRRWKKAKDPALKSATQKLQDEYDAYLKQNSQDADALLVADYELAMSKHFPQREFDKAMEVLRKHEKDWAKSCDGGRYINEAQGLVAEFEALRQKGSKGSIKGIRRLVRDMQKCAQQLDSVCQRLRRKKKFPQSKLNFRERWRVTSRLHAARMAAYGGMRSCMLEFEQAVLLRDTQTSDTGYSRYTTSLLLHTLGECKACLARRKKATPESWKEAIETLALAGRWIIKQTYKDYEYLENVLDRLKNLPGKANRSLDDEQRNAFRLVKELGRDYLRSINAR